MFAAYYRNLKITRTSLEGLPRFAIIELQILPRTILFFSYT